MGKILEMDFKALITIFVGAIVAIVFLGSIADSIYEQTNTFKNDNETVTAPAINGTSDLTGRELVGTAYITNITTGAQIVGFSIATGTSSSSGLRTVQLTLNDSAPTYSGKAVNVSYDYRPDGYLNLAGARSIQTLILIIGALAILVFVIVVFIKKGSWKEMFSW